MPTPDPKSDDTSRGKRAGTPRPDSRGDQARGPEPDSRGDQAGTPEPDSGGGKPAPGPDTISDTVARLSDHQLDTGERQRLLGRLITQTASRAWQDGWLGSSRALFGNAVDLLMEIAERIPLRDLETLRQHHPGLSYEELAARLIRNASHASAAIGAVGGGVAAVEWSVPPTLLTAPVLLAAETVGIAAVELKLIGELQEVYRQPVAGTPVQRATALLGAWADRRGVNPLSPGRGMSAVLSTTVRTQLRDRLLRRLGRNLTTLAPMLAGAAIAAELNRRATRAVGEEVCRDLRRRLPQPEGAVVDGSISREEPPGPALPR